MSASSLPPNREIVTAQPLSGLPTPANFRVQDAEQPKAPADGELLVTLIHVSVDPYLRGAMASVPVGGTWTSAAVVRVVESRHANYAVGDHLVAYLPWRINQVFNPDTPSYRVSRVPAGAPASTALGVLGMPGRTAYFGLFDAAQFKQGDIVLVSGAAGAVGSLVGQLAKLRGAKKVVGVAGGAAKCKLVVDKYGFDACIDYKVHDTIEKMRAELKSISPDGYDVYFDNVGGHTTSAFFDVVRVHARVVICGQISAYNNTDAELIPNPLIKTIYTRVNIRGFLVWDYRDKYPKFFEEVLPLVQAGKIAYDETVFNGFAALPEAFIGLFEGKNTGKAVVSL